MSAFCCPNAEVAHLRAQVTELQAAGTALVERSRALSLIAIKAIENWEDAAGYVATWAREKHGHTASDIAAVRAAFEAIR